MKEIDVVTKNKMYPISVGMEFGGLSDLACRCGLNGRTLCIVSDSNVAPIYIEKIKAAFKDSFSAVYEYIFKAGEKSKNIETVKGMYDFFLDKKLDRKTVIAGLGGGVCGDMAGFAAATYLRGVKFIQIPTTLLAQVDSSVGGKVGIDYKNSKNVVGAFYQPDFVYINTETIRTLPKREFSAGMAEVIKYGLIADAEFYNFIKTHKYEIKNYDSEIISQMILKCCKIKADVVSKDEKEDGLREILNFGHTIGHAVETVKNFELLHGECVAAGMAAVLNISLNRGYIEKGFLDEFTELIEFFGLPPHISGIDCEAVYKQMFFDKKVRDNKINFVIMKSLGNVFRTDSVSKEEAVEAIKSISG
ncbi:3-dehydroquinate synthase [Anaerotignum faecicola]|nr:3-dehydroquinate synthase [Anaerotignum faecicola]